MMTTSEEQAPARVKPRVWPLLLAYVLLWVGNGVAALVLAAILAAGIVARERGAAQDVPGLSAAVEKTLATPDFRIGSVVIAAAVGLGIALIAAALGRERVTARLRLRALPRPATGFYVVGCLFGLAASSGADALVVLLGLPLPATARAYAEAINGVGPMGLVAALLAFAVAAPIAEECLFRGYIQTRLSARFGARTGIVVTALAFGLIHVDLVHAAEAAVIGVALGWLAERSGSILPGIAAHMANNLVWVLTTRLLPSLNDAWLANLLILVFALLLLVASILYLRRWRAPLTSTEVAATQVQV